MNIAEAIKAAREALGLTQEDLAEKVDVSRQAVSKWEQGASLPSPENLKLLEEVLGVTFPRAEPGPGEEPQPASKAAFWNWERVVLLILGVLALLALLSVGIFTALREPHTDIPRLKDPYITDIAFFDENASPLSPDLGDGWNSFPPRQTVLMVVEFQDGWNADLGAPASVDAVSLFLTPTGTETYDLRQQLAVQAVPDGRHFALFAWDIPQDLMGHLEIVLECGSGQRVTKTLNVTAAPSSMEAESSAGLTLNALGIEAVAGDMGHYVLEAYGAPMAEVEWISSNPAVARVSNTGTVFIEGVGEAVITASWNGQTAECPVRVFAEEDIRIAYGEPNRGTEGNMDLPEGSPGHPAESGQLSFEPAERQTVKKTGP